jgi:hypothetical protein
VVAGRHVVTRHAQDVGDTQRRRSQEIRLQRKSVPIPTRELHHRLDAGAGKQVRGGERRDMRMGGRVVRAVDGVDAATQVVRELEHGGRIGRVGRLQLGGHHELPGKEQAVKLAPRLGHPVPDLSALQPSGTW